MGEVKLVVEGQSNCIRDGLESHGRSIICKDAIVMRRYAERIVATRDRPDAQLQFEWQGNCRTRCLTAIERGSQGLWVSLAT